VRGGGDTDSRYHYLRSNVISLFSLFSGVDAAAAAAAA